MWTIKIYTHNELINDFVLIVFSRSDKEDSGIIFQYFAIKLWAVCTHKNHLSDAIIKGYQNKWFYWELIEIILEILPKYSP